MKEFKPGDIRNFAIVGHASSGKTMLSEAMLECAGVINRMGSIAAGSTVSDYHDNEQTNQYVIEVGRAVSIDGGRTRYREGCGACGVQTTNNPGHMNPEGALGTRWYRVGRVPVTLGER